jgi:L-serine/L-threonine ammonia-lyase
VRCYSPSVALHIHTPLIQSQVLSAITGREVYLKLEALQPSGSFKIRGVGALCESLKSQGVARFISSSGGNAGMAVAYAGSTLGVPVTVIVPQTTTERAKQIIQGFGAEVQVHGASWKEANELAESLVPQQGALVHPFDHPMLWEGNSSMVDEIISAGVIPDAIVVSVGGGGLYIGVAEGLRRNGLTSVPIIAAETEGTASFHRAIREGRLVELDAIHGVATSLGAKRVAQRAFDLSSKHPTRSAVVSDAQAVSACRRFLNDHRLLVEPACGAALAPLYGSLEELGSFKKIVCIVCGGSTITAEQLLSYCS